MRENVGSGKKGFLFVWGALAQLKFILNLGGSVEKKRGSQALGGPGGEKIDLVDQHRRKGTSAAAKKNFQQRGARKTSLTFRRK